MDNKTNQTVNKARVHVADIPVKTPFNTYLIDGTHYQAKNQSQLKGTAYTRITGAGNIESDFRLERGRNFSVKLDPETEQFMLKVSESRRPLYPLLKSMGASDEQIRQRWGGQIAQKNRMSDEGSGKVIKKFARKVFGEARLKDQPDEAVKDMVHDHFAVESHLNPEASRLTLGQDYSRVTPEAVLAAIGRILDLYRGTGKPDSRDEIYYKRFRDLPETGKEFLKENKPNLQRRIARQLEKEEITQADLRSTFGPGLINPTVKAIFSHTKLQGAGETTNILDMLSSDSKVTVTGEHGISSEHKVTEQARDVRASGLGFIDPVKTPAGGAGVTEHLAINTNIEGGKIKTSLVDVPSGKRLRLSPEDLFGKTVAFPEEMELQDGRWRASGRKVKAVKDGEIVSVKPGEVDYLVPTATEMYSEVTNLVPFLSSNSGGRSILGTAQMVQAVPLKDREAPLVGSGNLEESEAFSLGQRSPVDGVVLRVQKAHVKVREKGAGKIHTVPVFDNMPLNRGSFLHSYPLVKAGDQVQKGQLLADNNFTQGGTLAIGRNLNTGIMPWLGYGFEDGVVISDAAAKSLTSEHSYDLSKTLDSRMEASPGRFTTYGKKYKIDAMELAWTASISSRIRLNLP